MLWNMTFVVCVVFAINVGTYINGVLWPHDPYVAHGPCFPGTILVAYAVAFATFSVFRSLFGVKSTNKCGVSGWSEANNLCQAHQGEESKLQQKQIVWAFLEKQGSKDSWEFWDYSRRQTDIAQNTIFWTVSKNGQHKLIKCFCLCELCSLLC